MDKEQFFHKYKGKKISSGRTSGRLIGFCESCGYLIHLEDTYGVTGKYLLDNLICFSTNKVTLIEPIRPDKHYAFKSQETIRQSLEGFCCGMPGSFILMGLFCQKCGKLLGGI